MTDRNVVPFGKYKGRPVEELIADGSSLRPRRTWRPAAIPLRSSAGGIGAMAVVAAAAIIVLAMVMIVVAVVGLVILIALGMFWAARRYYRRRTSS
jgi:hypothetical protein